MAISYTVDGVQSLGNIRLVHGTFTSAAGDNNGSITATTHGLNHIVGYQFTLDTGGLETPAPKVTVASGSITVTWTDTLGYSGKFWIMGK